MIALALTLPALFAGVDRWWGAPNRKAWAKALAVVLVACAWLAGSWPSAALAVILVAGRSLGFKRGAATSAEASWPRAILPAVAAMPTVWLLTQSWPLVLVAAVAFGAYAMVTVALAEWYGGREAAAKAAGRPIDPQDNERLELLRGAVGGAALAIWTLWRHVSL